MSAELIGQTTWDDPVVRVSVLVAVTPDYPDPIRTAENLVRTRLEKSRGTVTNWHGCFAIVLDVAGDGGEIKIESLPTEP